MTGFQPHPGLDAAATDEPVRSIDIAAICRAVGAEVQTRDPFDLEGTRRTLLDMMQRGGGAKVLILKQICALSPEKRRQKRFEMSVDREKCLGERCGCNRLCTRIFRCPGLIWDAGTGSARIDEVICAGCGVCSQICPAGAITAAERTE